MQGSEKVERLLRGKSASMTQAELEDFENYCSEEAILPQQLIKAAIGLYRRSIEAAVHFLSFVASQVITKERYNNAFYKEDKIRLLEYLTILTLAKATKQSQIEVAQHQLLQAKQHLIAAQKVSEYVPFSTMINRAFIYYYEGEVTKAIQLCLKIEEGVQNCHNQRRIMTITLLLLARCFSAKRAYEKSLECYKKCLRRNNYLSIKARLGMAYCYFNSKQFEVAQACFERILKLDGKCYRAMIGLAIVHERNENYQQYFFWLNEANKLKPNYPLLTYLIAENYLVQGQLDKCQEMCNKTLKNMNLFTKVIKPMQSIRNDYQEITSRLLNICGQIQHKKGNFNTAIEFYEQAAQKQLLWNDISLAQCLIAVQRYKDALALMDFTYKNYEKQKKDSRLLKDSFRIMAYLKYKCSQSLDSKQTIEYYTEAIKYDKNDLDLKCQLSYHLTMVDQHKALRVMQQLQKMSQSCGVEVKPQILINIGVLAMKNHEPEEAESKLTKAIQMIEKWDDLDLVQQTGFLIIAKYNYGICMESLHCNNKAISTYDEIIKGNKYHIDSYLRKAYVLHKLGNVTQSMYTLSIAQSVCKAKALTGSIDKIKLLKVYFLYELKKYEDALTLLGTISQKEGENVYEKVLEYSIRYASLFQKNMNPSYEKIHHLQVEGRQFIQRMYQKDNQPLYFWIMAAIIMASLKEITKQQGINTFKNILVKSSQIPSIRYNMGLYYMSMGDNDAAKSCFTQCRETNKCKKADQLLSFICLNNKDYKMSIKTTKRNIIMDPSNIKYRAQLMYIIQSRCEEEAKMKESAKTKKMVLNNCEELKICNRFHQFINSVNLSNLAPSMEQKKELLCGLKVISQEKIITNKIVWESFETIRKQKYDEQAAKARAKLDRSDQNESQDEEQKRKRENEEKKRMVLAKSKLKNQQLKVAWSLINQKKEEKEKERPKRKQPKPQDQQPHKKSLNSKTKLEEGVKLEGEDYYNVGKEKPSKRQLVKLQSKEDEHSETSSLKRYMVE